MAAVRIARVPACQRCAQGRGCGLGALAAGQAAASDVKARVPERLTVAPGDCVEVSCRSETLLSAAWLAYGLPLAGALLGGLAAASVTSSDAWQAAAALGGLLFAAGLGRRSLQNETRGSMFYPEIQSVKKEASID